MDSPTCSKCNYDLSGQGRQRWGRCPECGQEIDLATGEGVRSGSGPRQSEIDAKMDRIKAWVWLAVTVVLMALGVLISLVSNNPNAWMWTGCLALVTGLAAATAFLSRPS